MKQELEEVERHIEGLKRAVRYAYSGSAENGSFIRRGGGEYAPSVFMTMERLDEALFRLRQVAGVDW